MPASAVIDAVVGHHLDPARSGVARFNQILAERLGVDVVAVADGHAVATRECPLFSFKFGELGDEELTVLDAATASRGEDEPLELFLHDYSALPLERGLVERARRVLCGNHEILASVEPFARRADLAWAPGLIVDTRRFEPTSISVFSFGMAHKLQTRMFERLRALLEASGETFAIYVSNANHETATLDDAYRVYEEMQLLFPRGLYFMGNLSDVAVYNQLVSTTFFAAFFPGGARANNTSLASAMEHGAVVITNLDEHSPSYLRHMETVIDIERCEALPRDPLVLKRLSVAAMEAAKGLSWERLVEQMRA